MTRIVPAICLAVWLLLGGAWTRAQEPVPSGQAGQGAGARIQAYIPLAGADGYLGLEMRAAMQLAIDDAGGPVTLAITDLSGGGVSNPHQDEGQGNFPDVNSARDAGRGRQPAAVALLVGPRSNVAAALCGGMHGWKLPAIAIVPRPIASGACAQFVVGDAPVPPSAAYSSFAERFHAKTGTLPMLQATAAYAAMSILIRAVRDNVSRTELCTRSFATVQGAVTLRC